MIEFLDRCPTRGNPSVYVTIFQGIGGWNSGVFRWDEEEFGFYEPQMSGFNNTSIGRGDRKGAIIEAIGWAEDENIPIWIDWESEEEKKSMTGKRQER